MPQRPKAKQHRLSREFAVPKLTCTPLNMAARRRKCSRFRRKWSKQWPFAGVVYSLPVRQGTYVNPGDLVLQEADLSKILVRAYVDEPDVARLSPGQRIEVTWDAVPGRIWTGAVSSIPAAVKLHGTRNVGETTCTVPNQDFKLLPNINVGVTIVTAEHDHVLIVPREALRMDAGKPYLYVVANNEIQQRNVETAISDLTKAE